MKRILCATVMPALVAWLWAPASSQLPPNPPENHYLVWNVGQVQTVVIQVHLDDQFGPLDPPPMLLLEKWGNPIEQKNGEPVLWDPLVHHAWYRFEPPVPQPQRLVKVEHQFGVFNLALFEAVYLINPADKHDQLPGWPEWANHYLCYTAQGPPLELPVTMNDQWGLWQNLLHEPACFCNPVEKTAPDGMVYPIMEPSMHLTCYLIDPIPFGFPFFMEDQFGFWDIDALDQCFLCLPSVKLEVIPAEEGTWGRIKSLFSN